MKRKPDVVRLTSLFLLASVLSGGAYIPNGKFYLLKDVPAEWKTPGDAAPALVQSADGRKVLLVHWDCVEPEANFPVNLAEQADEIISCYPACRPGKYEDKESIKEGGFRKTNLYYYELPNHWSLLITKPDNS